MLALLGVSSLSFNSQNTWLEAELFSNSCRQNQAWNDLGNILYYKPEIKDWIHYICLPKKIWRNFFKKSVHPKIPLNHLTISPPLSTGFLGTMLMDQKSQLTSRAMAIVPNALNGSFVWALYRPSSCPRKTLLNFLLETRGFL